MNASIVNPAALMYEAELKMADSIAEGERQRLARLVEPTGRHAGVRRMLASWLLSLALRLDGRAGDSAPSLPAANHA